MDRTQKQEVVASLRETFSQASVVVVTHFTGLTAGEASELRREMKSAGAEFKVTKNRLAKRAVADTVYSSLGDLFTGPTAIAYSEDPVAAAKASVAFAKTNDHLVIIGGALGDKTLDEAGVKALASLPSLDELRGKIVGLLQAPAGNIARTLQAPGGQLARVVNAYATKDKAA